MRTCTLGRASKTVNAVDSDLFHNVTPIFRSSSELEKASGADSRAVYSSPSSVDARVIDFLPESNTIFPHPGKAPVPRIDAGSFFPTTHLPDKPDAVVEPAKTQADSTSPPRKFACVPHRLASTGCAGAQADTEAGQAAALTCPQQFVNPTVEVAYEEKYQVEKNCNAKKGKDAENVGSSRGSNPGGSSDSERSNPGVAKADSAKVQVCGGAGVHSSPPYFSSESLTEHFCRLQCTLGGGEYLGLMTGLRVTLCLFRSPKTGTSLGLPVADMSAEEVRKRIKASDVEFGVE